MFLRQTCYKCSNLTWIFLQTADVSKVWTLTQIILAQRSRWFKPKGHLFTLPEEVSEETKQDKQKHPPHPPTPQKPIDFFLFFLTCSSYGTTGWNRQFLLVGSILTTPERHCSGCDAVRSSTKTNLDWEEKTPNKKQKTHLFMSHVWVLWTFWHTFCHTTVRVWTHGKNLDYCYFKDLQLHFHSLFL